MKTTIELTRQKISEATEAFYQGKSKEGYEKVSEIAVYLLNLNQKVVDALENRSLVDYNQNRFMEILNEMLNAMTAKDSVLLSDILHYDMLEELEHLEECL